ncbi:MAG: phosphatidate cytidylyltransferase [Beijerinckiaceae bacterium]|jgi:phosphatidate cytidylyltransferase|nr:phosphatidate cytidylyltransferase [Beijerinckiaceae bacterium]
MPGDRPPAELPSIEQPAGQSMPPGGPSASRSELSLRIRSGLVMVAVALLTLWWGGWPFALLWVAVGAVAAIEWLKIVSPEGERTVRLLAAAGAALAGLAAHLGWEAAGLGACALTVGAVMAATPKKLRLVAGAGVIYATAIAMAPIIVRAEVQLGLALIAWCFAVVWSTDVAAYFTGRALGGPKLWPSVSPKKTWSGAIGGALAGIAAGLLVAWVSRRLGAAWSLGFIATAGCAMLASAAGQMGDLLESSLKRHFGVKDSGSIIPGHGGVLDRLDAFVVVVTLVAIAVAIWR